MYQNCNNFLHDDVIKSVLQMRKLFEMIKMTRFEHLSGNLFFCSNSFGDSLFDLLWCVYAGSQWMHFNVIMNRCAPVESVRFMILCIAQGQSSDTRWIIL